MIVANFNFKPHRDRTFAAGGWSHITKIETQVWIDEYGNAEDEVIWLLTDDAIFARSLLKGENIADVANYYGTRGYTDHDACFFASDK
jgi:hypothetical protein